MKRIFTQLMMLLAITTANASTELLMKTKDVVPASLLPELDEDYGKYVGDAYYIDFFTDNLSNETEKVLIDINGVVFSFEIDYPLSSITDSVKYVTSISAEVVEGNSPLKNVKFSNELYFKYRPETDKLFSHIMFVNFDVNIISTYLVVKTLDGHWALAQTYGTENEINSNYSLSEENGMTLLTCPNPCPTGEEIFISYDLNEDVPVYAYLTDLYGKQITELNDKFSLMYNKHTIVISTSNLIPGSYLVVVKYGDQTVTSKIVVK